MPVYPGRRPGTLRVIVWANGRRREKILEGSRELAELQELEFREELGAKPRDPVQRDNTPPELASRAIWIGSHAKSFVYFVQSGDTGPIKIGFSSRASLRLSSLQQAIPEKLWLRCVIPGGRILERILHNTFTHYRLRGEWFRPNRQLTALIDELSHTLSIRSFNGKKRRKPKRMRVRIPATVAPEQAEAAE